MANHAILLFISNLYSEPYICGITSIQLLNIIIHDFRNTNKTQLLMMDIVLRHL